MTNSRKVKNIIGLLYEDAKKTEKLCFRAELLKSGDRDGVNYMKRFQDTWQFVETPGIIPHAIIQAAKNNIGYVENMPTVQPTGLRNLKMI